MKVIVTGSRDWDDYEVIHFALASSGVSFVVEGGARGADRLARQAAIALGIPYATVEAEWTRYGKAAGALRNQAMLDQHPDAAQVFAFPLPQSIGTLDMIRRSKDAGRIVVVWHRD